MMFINLHMITSLGTLVAVYNGVKKGPYADVTEPDDWEKCGYSIGYYESTTADRGNKVNSFYQWHVPYVTYS